MSDVAVKTATGLYSTKYRLLLSVPIAIATAMSASILPSIVASFSVGDGDEVNTKIALGIKFNMLIAFPCFIGLSVLGKPILQMIFPSQDFVTGGYLLAIGSVAVVFYAVSNITGAILQGINKMNLPVIHSAISLVIHVLIVVLLLLTTNMGIMALVIGNIMFPLVVCILNMRSIYSYTTYRQEYIKTFGVPLISATIMGGVCYGLYNLLYKVFPHNTILVIFSVLISALVYFYMYFILKGATREEIYEFPMGVRIVKLANKLHIKI